ncbi:MAG: oligosaccharide flippase family protein [Chitinophagaceae bacterium]
MSFLAKNKLLFNFFSLGAVQAITALLQLFVIPYVVRHVGVEGFGIIAVAQVVMFYFSAITEYGFNQTATREISIERNNNHLVSVIFARVLFSRLALCVISFILLLILIAFVPLFHEHKFLYLTGFVFVIGQAALCNWFFNGIEKMQLMAVINLLARLIFVALIFLFLKKDTDAWYYLFFLGLGNLIMGLFSISLVILRFKIEFVVPRALDVLNELRKGWQITVTNLSNNICQYSNVFILRIFTNDMVTGYYSIAERIFLTLRQMPGIYSQTIYPQVCLVVDKGKEATISFFKKNYIPFLVAVITGCICLFFFSPQIIYFVSKETNGNSVNLLRIFSIVLFVVCLNIPATLILLAKERRQTYFNIYTIGVIVNVLLNISLAWFFKSTGTAIAILLTELFIAIGLTKAMLSVSKPNETQITPPV